MRAWRFGLAAALAVSLAAPVQAEPRVWVVRDADSEMLIFGSVHVLPPGLSWRPAALDAALRSAEDLWFELPVDAATERETARLGANLGVLPLGQSLFGLLTPADAAKLSRLAQVYGIDRMTLGRLKPWLAEVALASALYGKFGAVAEHGVEASVSATAPATLRRRALETPAQQLSLFDQTPLADQITSLRETMDELDQDPGRFRALIDAWIDGDMAGLERETLSLRKASPDLFRRLITERNATWTRTLDARLKGRGRTVVVVGAGHLVGEDGLPTRLRALGYSVSGP